MSRRQQDVRIGKHCDASRSGYQLTQKPQPFCVQLCSKRGDTCHAAARPRQARHKTEADWIFGDIEDDRIVVVATLAARALIAPPVATITATR